MDFEIKRPRAEKIDFEFVVLYKDGTTLSQQYGTSNEKNFRDIDQEKLKKFSLTNGHSEYSLDIETGEFNLNGMVIRFSFPGNDHKNLDRRLIYFRRILNQFGPGAEGVKVRSCLGYQVNIGGENHQRLVFIESDGSITISTKK